MNKSELIGKKEAGEPYYFQYKGRSWEFYGNNLPKKNESEDCVPYTDTKGWLYGSLINTNAGEYVLANEIEMTEDGKIIPKFWGYVDTVCLNSGIKDQDGTFIYENDVITIENKSNQRYTNVVIIWNNNTNSLGYFEYNPQSQKCKFHNLKKKKSQFYRVLFNCYDSKQD